MALVEFKDLPDTSTPINATNLNNNFQELTNKWARLKPNLVITLTGTSETAIPLSIDAKNGNFTVNSNGELVIGSDISKIQISGQLYFYQGTANTKRIFVKKNGTNVIRSIHSNFNSTSTFDINAKIIDVTEGDIISVYVTGSNGETIQNGIDDSYISILKIA